MKFLSLSHVFKDYMPGFHAVSDFNMEIEQGEFLVLVGPSGCGKSTTLRMIAGLEDITSGDIVLEGRKINDLHPKDRDISMVFQNYALYPHMTVRENLSFGLKMKKIPENEISERVEEAAGLLEISGLLERKPAELSGGQRQRVALGRAIVRKAALFLMDEPLSNLDAKLRAGTRAEIIKLHRRLKTTTIYVTHDQTEAMTMATRIVVMRDGFIQQTGTPHEIYSDPVNKFVAEFIGSPGMNFFKTVPQDSGLKTDSGLIPLPNRITESLKDKGYSGKPLIAGIRPEHFSYRSENSEFSFRTKAELTELTGAEVLLHFILGEKEAVARIGGDNPPEEGKDFIISYRPEKILFFNPETEERIKL